MPDTEVFIKRLDQYHRDGMYLGRHVVHDPRSKDFAAERASRVINVRHASVGLPLDQGSVGSCTANAFAGACNLAPNYKPSAPPKTEEDAKALYHEETTLEGQPWPPNDPGGSGLEVCKAAVKLGELKSRHYHHAFGIQHALEALVLRPVMFGLTWYNNFFHPDGDGNIIMKPGDSVAGGHEIVADEIDTTGERIGLTNSWGAGWGLGGRFYISYSLMEQLLADYGDCTVPVL